MVFAWLAATHYWFPKFSGRMYSEAVGKLAAWVAFIAFNATFFPMFIAGVQGMNRRVSVYLPYLEDINPWISLWAFVLGLARSEEHTSELQSLMRISYAVFCLKKKNNNIIIIIHYLKH